MVESEENKDQEMVLALAGIWWRYPTFSEQPGKWLLKNISLQVRRGECLGITGPSGAGKTTLCRVMMGILPTGARLTPEQLPHHFRGSVTLLGEKLTTTVSDTRKMGMVLQDPENQFLRMSVLHELALGLQLQGLSRTEILRRSEEALRGVGLKQLWPGALYRHPNDLSGGQKQRIAIASFLALRPQILILDEPTSDLDPVGKRDVIETLTRLQQEQNITLILVEQDPDILAAFCDRIALLNDGRIEGIYSKPVGAGAADDVGWGPLGRPFSPEMIIPSNEISSSLHGRPKGPYPASTSTPAPTEEKGIVGERGRRTLTDTGVEMVAYARDVRYRYEEGTVALHGIEMDLYRGEMLALLGQNGSGKTTFAKILAGLLRPTGGQVELLGQDITTTKGRKYLAGRVGYVFQNPDHQLFQQTVQAEIAYGLKNLGIGAEQRRAIVAGTLERVGLREYADENPLFLSKGQRQRLAVAALLAMGPEILIVDEPTTGQDAHSISTLMEMLCQLQQQGTTILLITHDMALVAQYCQRTVVFREGRVCFSGTPAKLFGDEELLHMTGLRAPGVAALALRSRMLRKGVVHGQAEAFDDGTEEA